jgi:hypothetical protein
MNKARTIAVRSAVVFICLLLALALAPVGPAEAILPGGTIIYSGNAPVAPVIDGDFDYGKWPNEQIIIDAPIHTRVYFMNNNEFLYVCVDAATVSGDYTDNADDHCTLYFDTGHDEQWTAGHEDVFKVSGNGVTEHFVAENIGSDWVWESCCSPFAHPGLEAAAGFGDSPDTMTDHRIYEFQIPLSLIGASPGDVIGFASPDSLLGDPPHGLWCIPYDAHTDHRNVWPDGALWDDMSTWGDLILAKPAVEMWKYSAQDDITDIAVGELNGDDNEDVLAIDAMIYTLHVLRGEGDGAGLGDLLWEKSIDGFSVAVGDIDGDTVNEVIAAGNTSSNKGIYAYEHDGTPKWFYPILDDVTDIEIGDIDGNLVDDVVACDPTTSGVVYVINGTNGDNITGWPKEEMDEWFLDIAVGQLDDTGGEDVAAIGLGLGGEKTLHVYNTSGSWMKPIQGRTVEIGDVDGNGSNEVVAGTSDNWVRVYQGNDGTLLYSYYVFHPVTDVELGDLDGNPENGVEVACMTNETIDTLYALDMDNVGDEMMWWDFIAWDSEYYGESIAIGDVDRDYKNEVVACSSLYYHYVYAYDGLDSNGDGYGDMVWPPYEISSGYEPRITDLEIGDLDGDGDKDVVFGTVSCGEAGAKVYAIANPESKASTATGSGEAYFDSDPSTLANLTPIDESTLPEAGKPDYDYPHGFFSFTITGLTPGQQAIVTVTLPGPAPVGTKWVKCHDGVYYILPIGDDDGDNVITVELTDNVTGEDDDKTLNGIIVDDGGPGYPKAPPSPLPPSPPPTPGGPVGIHVAQIDKFGLLAPWLILAALILCGGIIVMRRRAHR